MCEIVWTLRVLAYCDLYFNSTFNYMLSVWISSCSNLNIHIIHTSSHPALLGPGPSFSVVPGQMARLLVLGLNMGFRKIRLDSKIEH